MFLCIHRNNLRHTFANRFRYICHSSLYNLLNNSPYKKNYILLNNCNYIPNRSQFQCYFRALLPSQWRVRQPRQ